MAIILELTPEQEEQLREAALVRGVTVEGYLLTLVEAIMQPQATSQGHTPLYRRALVRLFRKGTKLQAEAMRNPDQVVRESIRQMRESVLKYKEQAVDAATTMNMLRSAVEVQERQSAEKEFKALRALAAQDRERAKRLWQEKTVLDKHRTAVQQELYVAIAAAAALTRAFRQEEERAQERASKAQAGALKAYKLVMLPADRIAPLIKAYQTEAEWDQAFEEWALETMQRLSESTLETDLPKPAPVDDAEAFTDKARDFAREIKNEPSAFDFGNDDAP
jgi:hypothetical protein